MCVCVCLTGCVLFCVNLPNNHFIQEHITCKVHTDGKEDAASFLVVDILSRAEDWYELLLSWLRKKGHQDLVKKIEDGVCNSKPGE